MTTNRGWILSRYFLLGVVIATAAMLLLGCATPLDKNYAAYLAAQQAAVAGKKPQPIFELEAHDGQPITGLKSLRVFAPEGGGHQVALAPPPQREDFFDKSIRLLGAISPLAGTAIQTVYAHKSQVAQAQTNRDIALSTNATYAAFGNNIQGTATAGLAATRDTGVAGIAGVVSAANAGLATAQNIAGAGFAATTSIATGGFTAATGIAQSGFTAMAQSNGAAWANIGSLQPNITVGAGGVFGNGNRTTNGNGNDNSGVLVTGSDNRLNSNDDYSKHCASGAGASGGGGGGGTGGAAGNGAAGGAGATGGAAGGGGAGGSASGTTGTTTAGSGANGAPGGTGGTGGLGGTGGAGGFGSGGGGGAGGASGTVGC